MDEPDVPTPIDQIAPEVLNSWDMWIRERLDKSKQFTTTAPEGVTQPRRDRPLVNEKWPDGSRNDFLLAQKSGDY